jgi:uncharacterized protein YgiB involved in biofilm formation
MSTRFKRSRKAALMVMVPAATTFLLASCAREEPIETAVYETAEQCAGFYNPEQCLAEFNAAKALHPQVAPKYTDQAACETDFGVGNCEVPASTATTAAAPTTAATSSSGSFFMPMMMGFMAGQLMNGANKGNLQSQPLYKSRDDNSTFRTANNQPVSRFTGPVKVMPSRMVPQPGKMVQRGGFGAQAQRRSEQSSSGG